MQVESRYADVNGLRMHYVTAGEGPPVLLLHGFPDTHAIWRHQIAALAAAGMRVIAPDLRGYGQTDMPAEVGAYAIAFLADDVLRLMDALGIERAALVGHDWGSLIGWQLAMHAPHRIIRYAALSVGHPKAVARAGLAQRLRFSYVLLFKTPVVAEAILKANDWAVLRRMIDDREQQEIWRVPLEPRGRLTAALNYYRANLTASGPGRWKKVEVPVMGVWSDRDPALGEKQMADSGEQCLAGFRFERLSGADHWMQLSATARLNALLLDFLGAAGA